MNHVSISDNDPDYIIMIMDKDVLIHCMCMAIHVC